MDGGFTLNLPKNEPRVVWVLDRLRHDKSRKASTLAILQAVPLYYAAVAVRQSGTIMSSTNRDAMLADRYKSFIAPAFLRFLREEYNFQVPLWITTDLMGQTTFTGGRNSVGVKVETSTSCMVFVRERSPLQQALFQCTLPSLLSGGVAGCGLRCVSRGKSGRIVNHTISTLHLADKMENDALDRVYQQVQMC